MTEEILNEAILHQYFLFEAVLGGTVSDKKLFDVISRIFMPDGERAAKLFALTQQPTVNEIVTYDDAMRFARIVQYRELCGLPPVFADEAQTVAVKSSALASATENKLLCGPNATRSMICNCLATRARAGNVVAMRILGVLECYGIFAGAKRAEGVKRLTRAAKWADTVSMIALLAFLPRGEQFDDIVRCLLAAVRGGEYETVVDDVCRVYGIGDVTPSKEIKLLKKAFARGRADVNNCDSQAARMLYSNVLSFTDKERVLLDSKEAMAAVCNLPLSLECAGLQVTLDELPFRRERETSRIRSALVNSDLRYGNAYRPLCIKCEGPYVLECYANALCGMSADAHVERIDVADLKSYDLEPTINNIFVRSACDGKNNVYLLVLKGQVDELVLEQVRNFLSVKRRRFRLNEPCVTLDLGAILPVCICDGPNAARLKGAVETVSVPDISPDEKRAAVLRMLEEKSLSCLGRVVSAESGAVDVLCAGSLFAAETVLDRLLAENRFEQSFCAVTTACVENIVKLLEEDAYKSYGFGGYNNDLH